MAIKLLMMDFYGTLVREDDGLTRDICRRIVDTSPLNITQGDVAALWWRHMNEAFTACHSGNYMKLADIQQAILEDLTGHFESRADPKDMLADILKDWRQPKAYDDLRAFLSKFPLPICLVVNADADVLSAALKHSQLRFDHIVTSEAARCYKPNRYIFQYALETMNANPGEVLFVGDSLMYDIRPAGEAGMRTAWINRAGRPRGDTPVDMIVPSLMRLKSAVR